MPGSLNATIAVSCPAREIHLWYFDWTTLAVQGSRPPPCQMLTEAMAKRTTTFALMLPPRDAETPAYRWLCTALEAG